MNIDGFINGLHRQAGFLTAMASAQEIYPDAPKNLDDTCKSQFRNGLYDGADTDVSVPSPYC